MLLERRAARIAAAVIGVVGIAGLAWILEPHAYPAYDYAFALASAQDILAGRGTGYEVPVFAPVPHPLTLAEALLVVPLGDAAFPVFTAMTLLAFGLLCVSLFWIGSNLYSWPVGALAVLAVFTSPAIFELGTRTYGDVVYAALIVAAIALEVDRPRRGWPVLALLALAGLVRPEAWLLSGLYWLYLVWRRPWRDRLVLGLLAAAAPVLWTASDLALTGDPLHSVEVTRVYTEKANATVSADELWTAVRSLTGWPVLVGTLVGGVLAWRRDRGKVGAPLTVGTIALLATVAPSVFGESPVLRRYLVLPAVVASLFFAVACLGWTRSRARAAGWPVAGVGLLVLAIVVVAGERRDHWETHRDRQSGRHELLEHLRGWATSTVPRAYMADPACRPLLTPGYGYRPYLRYWLDVPPRAVEFHWADMTPERGVVLLPRAADGYQRLMLSDVGRRTRIRVLKGPGFTQRFRRVASSRRWELYASESCRTAVESRLSARGDRAAFVLPAPR